MKIKTLLLAVLTVISVPTFASHAPAKPTAPAPIACPSNDFKKFMKAFAESASLQKAFTKLPGVDNEETTFPMIFSASRRQEEGMLLHFESITSKTAKVVIDKDQTDYKVAFYFEKRQCWTLVKVEDMSG